MTTSRELDHRLDAERVVFFTDAIVAIAITLLVLPLLESIPEAAAKGQVTGEWLVEHRTGLLAFVVSFVVVAYSWSSHRRLFEGVEVTTSGLTWLNIAWALTIVFVQLPSAMIYQLPDDRWGTVLYVGTLATSQVLLALMSALLARRADLLQPGFTKRLNTRMYGGVVAIFALVLLIAVVAPEWGFYALFLLWLVPLLRRIPYVAQGLRELTAPAE